MRPSHLSAPLIGYLAALLLSIHLSGAPTVVAPPPGGAHFEKLQTRSSDDTRSHHDKSYSFTTFVS